jgi:hypothetical protein
MYLILIANKNKQKIYLLRRYNVVTSFEWHVSEVVLLGQRIWNVVGNRLVEAHVRSNAQATGTGTLEAGVSFA